MNIPSYLLSKFHHSYLVSTILAFEKSLRVKQRKQARTDNPIPSPAKVGTVCVVGLALLSIHWDLSDSNSFS